MVTMIELSRRKYVRIRLTSKTCYPMESIITPEFDGIGTADSLISAPTQEDRANGDSDVIEMLPLIWYSTSKECDPQY